MVEIEEINKLALEISRCRVCDDQEGIKVSHGAPMERGTGSEIFVIGVNPGKSEISKSKAFSGPAGKRLISWLQDAGVGESRDEILTRCYLTSLCKCHIKSNKRLDKAIKNCFPFLEKQIELIKPRICLTLGREPLKVLFNSELSLEDAVGTVWNEIDLTMNMWQILPQNCIIIPLPHPSPQSRWLNYDNNKYRLKIAIHNLKNYL